MVNYKCPRCNYNTYQKSDIRKHFLRKKICKPIYQKIPIDECYKQILKEDYPKCHVTLNFTEKDKKSLNFTEKNLNNSKFTTDNSSNNSIIPQFSECEEIPQIISENLACNFCKKIYTRKDNLNRHLKSCKKKNTYLVNSDTISYSAHEVEELLKKEREKSQYVIGELKSQIEVLLKNQGNNNTHTTNYNIVVNSFGKENLDYISNEFVQNLINSGPISSIPTLLKYIHFNPNHKENHNVKISNKKQNYAQIFNGIEWEYRDKHVTIEDMSDRAYEILNKHYISGSNKYMDSFKSQYDENSKVLSKRLHKDTELMILNNQKIF